MPDDTSLCSGPTHLGPRLQPQFSLRAMLLLMAACAIWWWLLLDLRKDPVGFAVFALITLAVGVGGHFLYALSSPHAERCWYPPSYCHPSYSAP
jgi:hypothetical protein